MSTPAQRRRRGADKKKRWREHYYALGLRRLELWAHPDDVAKLKDYAGRLLQSRGIQFGRSAPELPPSEGESPYS